MPVENNTQNQQSLSTTLAGSLVQTAKTAAAGAAIGAVGGKAVSIAAPVSHRQIASQIIDTYVSNNKNGFADLEKNLKNAEYKAKVLDALDSIIKTEPGDIKKSTEIAKKLEAIGIQISANFSADKADKDALLKTLNSSIADIHLDASKENIKAMTDSLQTMNKSFAEEATSKVETFFKQPRETISKLKKGLKQELKKGADLGEKYDVLYAKKCAKKLQSHKIMGVAIAAGVMSALFANLFGVTGSGKKDKKAQNEQTVKMSPSPQQPIGTTQG